MESLFFRYKGCIAMGGEVVNIMGSEIVKIILDRIFFMV
jgi:hypothetical protein